MRLSFCLILVTIHIGICSLLSFAHSNKRVAHIWLQNLTWWLHIIDRWSHASSIAHVIVGSCRFVHVIAHWKLIFCCICTKRHAWLMSVCRRDRSIARNFRNLDYFAKNRYDWLVNIWHFATRSGSSHFSWLFVYVSQCSMLFIISV